MGNNKQQPEINNLRTVSLSAIARGGFSETAVALYASVTCCANGCVDSASYRVTNCSVLDFSG